MRKRWIAAAAGLLALVWASSVQGVVINEFYYGTEPPGNNEWIELFNRSSSNINLMNWKVLVANGSGFVQVHAITSGADGGTTIPTSDYFLITDGAGAGMDYDVNNVNLNLGRASGTSVHGIMLVDDTGTSIDTVLYAPAGATNVYNLRDDDGYTSMTRVKGVVGDEALSRNASHTDTNDSSADFSAVGAGTPVSVEISRFELQ